MAEPTAQAKALEARLATIRSFSTAIRKSTLEMVHMANSSHVGSCFSMADVVAVLYADLLRLNPAEPNWPERDRFILSKGHACAVIYAALAERGFFPKSDLERYGADFSVMMAHISHKVPGVEFSTGSLGHGLPFALGKALAGKLAGRCGRVFVCLGDGEMDEGSNWEALLFAAHHRLDNLVAIIDANNLQSLATIQETLALEPLGVKIKAFGCGYAEIDGHDHRQILETLSALPLSPDKPNVVVARTIKGKGVGFMENKVEWHYRSPNSELLLQALADVEKNHA